MGVVLLCFHGKDVSLKMTSDVVAMRPMFRSRTWKALGVSKDRPRCMAAWPRGEWSDFWMLALSTVTIAAQPKGMMERRFGVDPLRRVTGGSVDRFAVDEDAAGVEL